MGASTSSTTTLGIAAVGGVVEVSEEEWDRVMAINLKSCFLADM